MFRPVSAAFIFVLSESTRRKSVTPPKLGEESIREKMARAVGKFNWSNLKTVLVESRLGRWSSVGLPVGCHSDCLFQMAMLAMF